MTQTYDINRPVAMLPNWGWTPLLDFYAEINSRTGQPRYKHMDRARMAAILRQALSHTNTAVRAHAEKLLQLI